ncbi:MAG: hypothetical protein JXR39_08725 [Marinilabiliaceae bacterium]|nr:hypothetical protein [Marinilabiliaceae bacterium]
METVMKPEILLSVVMSGMLGVVSYFLRQLLTDFKRVEKDVGEVKSTMALLKSEFKGVNDLMSQRIEFLEKRIAYLENGKK